MVEAKVRANIERYSLASAGQKVVVAVSGGVDSIALLHILFRLRRELMIQLHVASLNHGIRGATAAEDLRFVARLARQFGLPYTTGVANVPELAARERLGIEDAARRARYEFLARVALATGSRIVAVGHHALDQAETMLMHLLRGSGPQGLRGIRFSAPLPYHASLRLIRPLLNISREELEQYGHAHGLAYRHDRTNDDVSLQRNYLRHQVLRPLLIEHPSALRMFARAADVLGVEDDFVADRLQSEVLPKVEMSDGRWRIDKSTFNALHPALQRRLVRAAFEQLNGGQRALEFGITAQALAFCGAAGVGKCRDLGAGIRIRIGYDALYIEHVDCEPDPGDFRTIPAGTDLELDCPSTISYCGIQLELSPGAPSAASANALLLPAGIDPRLRTRRAGDRFRPVGTGGRSRKLKDWMIDRKIPREIRDRIPVICTANEVLAICLGSTWHFADVTRLGSGDDTAMTLRLN